MYCYQVGASTRLAINHARLAPKSADLCMTARRNSCANITMLRCQVTVHSVDAFALDVVDCIDLSLQSCSVHPFTTVARRYGDAELSTETRGCSSQWTIVLPKSRNTMPGIISHSSTSQRGYPMHGSNN